MGEDYQNIKNGIVSGIDLNFQEKNYKKTPNFDVHDLIPENLFMIFEYWILDNSIENMTEILKIQNSSIM